MESPSRRPSKRRTRIGTRIRACRISAGLAQEQPAESVEIHRRALQKFEGGENSLMRSTLHRITSALRCPFTVREAGDPGAGVGCFPERGHCEVTIQVTTTPAFPDVAGYRDHRATKQVTAMKAGHRDWGFGGGSRATGEGTATTLRLARQWARSPFNRVETVDRTSAQALSGCLRRRRAAGWVFWREHVRDRNLFQFNARFVDF